MARYDVMKETYTEIRVLEKPALFSGLRLNRNTVPDGMYLYEVRHDDYGKGDPVQIGKGVLVNFWGSILTCEPLDLEEDGRLDIDPEQDWDYLEGKNCSIREFMEKLYISDKLTILHGQSDHLSRRFRSLISERDSRRSKSFL